MTNFPQQLSGYIAEIGSAFLCAELRITQDVRADHAHYLANWLQLWGAAHNCSNREVPVM
jgi:antirestriction protein ArdC